MIMKKLFPLLAALSVGVLLLLRPEASAQAVREGLGLCARTVIPSLFPFFAVVSLLLQLGLAERLQGVCAPFMGPMFHLRGICALPLLTGLLGGYPSGAKTAADLYTQGQITRREAELLLGFCDNCGPAFLLGYVGAGILGDTRAGTYLYLIHTAAALLAGMLLCRFSRDRGPALLRSSLPVKAVPGGAGDGHRHSRPLPGPGRLDSRCRHRRMGRALRPLPGPGGHCPGGALLPLALGRQGGASGPVRTPGGRCGSPVVALSRAGVSPKSTEFPAASPNDC